MKKRHILFFILIISLSASFMSFSYADSTKRLTDSAKVLTDSQAEQIESILGEISTRQAIDIYIVTVGNLGESSAKEAAKSYLTRNTYSDDYLLLFISYGGRDYNITSHGKAERIFTSSKEDALVDAFIESLSSNNYYKAFSDFAAKADDIITKSKGPPSGKWILIAILGGVFIAFLVTSSMKGQLKSVSSQRLATKYLVNSEMNKDVNKDIYLYSEVTKKKKAKDANSSPSNRGKY